NGQHFALTQALKNGPVVLAFFKISCPTCQMTFPFLQRLADASPSTLLIAVSQDDASATRGFQNRSSVSMPTLLDTPGRYPASNAYQVTSVPSLFVVEPNGKISFAVEGFSKAAIEKLGERFGASPFRETDHVPALRPG
ncbi:MAG TPA: TlpA disulfide reductase family protein, partial [Bryobacteraceae bacterium]